MKFNPRLAKTIELIKAIEVAKERRLILQPLIDYIKSKTSKNTEALLNFICTHNSRRSQFAQIWAQTAAHYYNVDASCYSGGVEVTACNERTIASITRAGFEVSSQGNENPFYSVYLSKNGEPVSMFSKLYDDKSSPTHDFAAVMTCSHADENCPLITGTESRIPVMYDDPKAFDDSAEESFKYDERSMQIASEMFYVFSNLKTNDTTVEKTKFP